eukprot:SAG22_NODE_167_length_16764_cov_34.845245_2_plen_346_part_00
MQRRCHNTDPPDHPGCTAPLSDIHSGLQTAERVCDTVHAVAGAIMANPVSNAACTAVDVVGTGVGLPGVCHEALYAVEGATRVASSALSFVDNHWDAIATAGDALSDLGFRRLDEAACGELAVADCEALRDRTTQLQQKMQSAKSLIATASSLAVLNSQVVASDNADSPVAAVKLDMSFLELDMLNDEVLVSSFQTALGDGSSGFEVEIRQIVTLIRNKLQQMRAYYQAVESKRSNELERDLLGRRAARASQLVTIEQNHAAQISAAQAYFDSKMMAYSHIGLQYVIQEARAFEHLTLSDLDPSVLNLDQLKARRMTGSQYQRFVAEAETRNRGLSMTPEKIVQK